MAAPSTYPSTYASLSSNVDALIGYQVPRDMAAPTYIPIPIKKSQCCDWLSGHEGRSCSHIHTHPYIKKSRCSDWLSPQEGHGDPTYIPIIPIEKSQCSDWLSDQELQGHNKLQPTFVIDPEIALCGWKNVIIALYVGWMEKCHNCSLCGVDEKCHNCSLCGVDEKCHHCSLCRVDEKRIHLREDG